VYYFVPGVTAVKSRRIPPHWLIYFSSSRSVCPLHSFDLLSHPLSHFLYARSVGTSSYSHSDFSGRLKFHRAQSPRPLFTTHHALHVSTDPLTNRSSRKPGRTSFKPFPAAGHSDVRHRRPWTSCCIHQHRQRRLLWVHRQLLTNAYYPGVRLFERIATYSTISPRPDGL
jgi:hypothetical protein